MGSELRTLAISRPDGWSPVKKSMSVLAAVFLVLAVSSGAFAAKGLLTGADVKDGSLTGADIKQGSLGAALFTRSEKSSLLGLTGSTGHRGAVGLAGRDGANGINGADGVRGSNGLAGTNGLAGSKGVDGTNGTPGAPGTTGTPGAPGTTGTTGPAGPQGTQGPKGDTGANGTVTPLWATAGFTPFPAVGTSSSPTTVISLVVPAGKYVILAKTQLTQSGAGDSVHCDLRANTVVLALDQIDMKILPALAGVPVSLQAFVTVDASTLSVECKVKTATGSADYSSLIAIPTS